MAQRGTWENPSSTDGAQFLTTNRSTVPKSAEAKMAKKLNEAIDAQSFSVEFLARFLTYNGTEYTRPRLLQFAKALVQAQAQQGTLDDTTTREAVRLLKKMSK